MELSASAGGSGSFCHVSLLARFRHSTELTDPFSPCYFCENTDLVVSASYCHWYSGPAKPQLVLISFESVLSN